MTKDRELLVVGRCHAIELAERADGSRPARIFLDQLKAGTWANPEDPHDDEQVSDYYKFLDMFKYLANNGTHRRSHDANYLRSGLWEFRKGNKRVSWYDVDRDGRHAPKTKSDTPEAGVSCMPGRTAFDYFIRLGHCFPKTGQKTEQFDLDEAEQVRREDLAHDSP